jgi:Bacterial Ig-like domain (group 1)
MSHTTPIIVRPTIAAILLGILGCGGDLVLPEAPSNAAEQVALTKAGGDEQSRAVGEALEPLVVQVMDENQHPVIGLSVAFQLSDPAGGAVSPATATTNSAGEAVAQWTLGTLPGRYEVVATLVGATGEDKVAEFHATAAPGAPASLAAQTPLDQPGRREQAVLTPPVVQVKDRFDNPVPGVAVVWQVIAGEGQAVPINGSTDSEGKASVQWTLGNRIGVHKLTAAVEGAGAPVTFTARVLF